MAQVKFSGLPSASSLAVADTFAVVQGGVSKQATMAQIPANVSLQTTVASPTGTASATAVMCGLGVIGGNTATLTPVASGKVWVTISGSIYNDTASASAQCQIYYGTGTAPSNGAAATGTAIGSITSRTGAWGASVRAPFALSAVISGLTLNTQIWVDLGQLAPSGGGTTSIVNVTVAMFEL